MAQTMLAIAPGFVRECPRETKERATLMSVGMALAKLFACAAANSSISDASRLAFRRIGFLSVQWSDRDRSLAVYRG
jgi:hypothetical protein